MPEPTNATDGADPAPTDVPDAVQANGASGGPGAGTDADAGSASHVCNVGFCPIGLALSAVQPMRPDAVEHLLVAGRELMLAMKAVVDARAEPFEGEGHPEGVEKIDIG
jgi:hypothetical protein